MTAKLLFSTALGLLLYTVIVSLGYYAQLGDFAVVGLFMVLTGLTVVALIFQLKQRNK